MPQQTHTFTMATNWEPKPVPKIVYHLAKNILDDQNAPTETRTLAAITIELAQTLDNFITAVETGTLTIVLPDDVAQRIARMRREGTLDNDDL